MLRIYNAVMEVVRAVRPILERVEQRDAAARYHTGAGSMGEVIAAIEVAEALGYIAAPDPARVDRMGLVVGTMVKNARP